MIETLANDPAGWAHLRTIDISSVRSFEVRVEEFEQVVRLISESEDGRSRLEVTFLGVVDLKVDWPSVTRGLDVIDIRDVSADGMENISYRVSEGEDFFAFWCREFFATTIRAD